MTEYEDNPNDWNEGEEEETISLSEADIKQLRKYCREIEGVLNDIYGVIGNQ